MRRQYLLFNDTTRCIIHVDGEETSLQVGEESYKKSHSLGRVHSIELQAHTNYALPFSSIFDTLSKCYTNPYLSGHTHSKEKTAATSHQSGVRVLLRPFATDTLCVFLILLVVLRNIRRERIVRVRGAKKGLDGEKYSADLERGGPFICNALDILFFL